MGARIRYRQTYRPASNKTNKIQGNSVRTPRKIYGWKDVVSKLVKSPVAVDEEGERYEESNGPGLDRAPEFKKWSDV